MKTDEQASGAAMLQKSASELWDAQHELTSYAFLLRHIGSGAESCEDLYGLGIALKRIAHLVAKNAERIEKFKSP